MLDVYFAMRYLQLRHNIPDGHDRSTAFMLDRLKAEGAISPDDHGQLRNGYEFLSTLDHHLRLTIGRTTRVPLGHRDALDTIATRMEYTSHLRLLEDLTFHRLAIRSAYESVLA